MGGFPFGMGFQQSPQVSRDIITSPDVERDQSDTYPTRGSMTKAPDSAFPLVRGLIRSVGDTGIEPVSRLCGVTVSDLRLQAADLRRHETVTRNLTESNGTL
jgi:hypothetical protein